jgi:hypothetical protein
MGRIGQEIPEPGREKSRGVLEVEAAAGEDAADDLRQIEPLADGERQTAVGLGETPAPAAAGALDRDRRVGMPVGTGSGLSD